MSDLKPVCSIKMWKLTEKSYFCALSVTFEAGVHFKVEENLLQGYVKWKNTMTFNVNFLKKCRAVEVIKIWGFLKINFCALYLHLGGWCAKVGNLLQGYVKWKNIMTFHVNFLTQNVGPWTCYKQCIWGYWPKISYFCALYVTFLRLGCILKLKKISFKAMLSGKNTMTFNVNFLTQNSGRGHFVYKAMYMGILTEKSYFSAL